MPDDLNAFNSAAFLNYLERVGTLQNSTIRRIALAADEATTRVERVILELGLLEEEVVYKALADFMGIRYVTIEEIDHDLVRSGLLETEFMKRASVVPIALVGDQYAIATAHPDMADTVASVGFLLNARVIGAMASPSTIAAALTFADAQDIAPSDVAASGDVERLRALANDGPVISLVNDIIGKAVGLGASDVHIEAQDGGARVRYRVDGLLRIDRIIPEDIRSSVASRLKIMANLNISEKRRPQDGRADIVVRGRNIDIRMSTLPTQFGESIVLRLLDRARMQLDWEALQFPSDRVAEIEKLMSFPNGIFLVAGPTGSGKTTTLYTALRGINTDDRKIVTVEDPVEYSLDGVNQVQVDSAIEMSFAAALRAILRQDPNVVMVGEIRDEETAEIAVRAALIGRLVLSTIHTNDAVSAVDRLIDLKVAPYLVGATLRGVLSQRLVRRNCADCAGAGCDQCGSSGKRGRMAVSELLTVSSTIADAIGQGARGPALLTAAVREGFIPIAQQAETLIKEGALSSQEAHRALGQD